MTVTALCEAPQTSFARATSQLLAGSVGAQVLVAITFAVIARGLGRPAFGLVVALLGAGAAGQDILDFGSSQWLSRELAAGRLTGSVVRRLLRRRALLVAGCCVVVAAALVAAGVAPLPVVATAAYVGAAVGNSGTHARLRAMGSFRRAAAHLVGERLVWLCLAVAVVASRPDRPTAAAGLVAAMAVAYLGSTLCAPRLLAAVDPAAGPGLRTVYRRSSSFGLLGLSSDLQQLDATATATLAGVGVAADVGIASKLTGPVGLVAGSVSQVAFRGVARGGDEARLAVRSALRISTALAVAVAAVAPVLPLLVVTVLGQQYDHARVAIVVYTVGTAVAVLNQPLAGVLTAAGHDRVVSRIIAVAVVAGLLVGSLTVRSLGATGMGAGFCLTQLLIGGCCGLLYRRTRS